MLFITNKTAKELLKGAILFAINCALASTTIDPIIDAEDRGEWDSLYLNEAKLSSIETLRIQAAFAYGRIQKPECIDSLFYLLNSENPNVSGAAAFNLGQLVYKPEFHGNRIDEIIMNIADKLALISDGTMTEQDSKSPGVNEKVALLDALGKSFKYSSHPNDIDKIISTGKYLKSKDPKVKESAILAVWRANSPIIPSNDIVKDIIKLAGDKHANVKKAVAVFCKTYSYYPDNAPHILQAIRSLVYANEFNTRLLAVIAMGNMKAEYDIDTLFKLLEDPVYSVRVEAVKALVSTTPKARQDTRVLSLSKDSNWHVRGAVATYALHNETGTTFWSRLADDKSPSVRGKTLTSYCNNFPYDPCYEQIKGAFFNQTQPYVVRIAAFDSYAQLNSAQFADLIKMGLEDVDPRVVATALDSLAYNCLSMPECKNIADTELLDLIKNSVMQNLQANEIYSRTAAVDVLTGYAITIPEEIYDIAWNAYIMSDGRKFISIRKQLITGIFAPNVNEKTTGYLTFALLDEFQSVSTLAREALETRNVHSSVESPITAISLSDFRNMRFERNPFVQVNTNKGVMVFELFAKEAPIHVANFVGLVQQNYYNGLTWHRVVDNFVIQGADKDGFGYGGDAGWDVRAEMNTKLYEKGTIGMPREDSFDSGGSQMFIANNDLPRLDGLYTVWGKVVRGLGVIDVIEVGDIIESMTVLKK